MLFDRTPDSDIDDNNECIIDSQIQHFNGTLADNFPVNPLSRPLTPATALAPDQADARPSYDHSTSLFPITDKQPLISASIIGAQHSSTQPHVHVPGPAATAIDLEQSNRKTLEHIEDTDHGSSPRPGFVAWDGEGPHSNSLSLKRDGASHEPVGQGRVNESPPHSVSQAVPPQVHTQSISWAGWDSAKDGTKNSKLLLLAHRDPSSISVWDCTSLDSMAEILHIGVDNLRSTAAGNSDAWEVASAAIIPNLPTPPVLGILIRPLIDKMDQYTDGAIIGQLFFFSLTTLRVMNRLDIDSSVVHATWRASAKVDDLRASTAGFILVTLTSFEGPTIFLFSSSTTSPFKFKLAYVVPPFQLAGYMSPPLSTFASSTTATTKFKSALPLTRLTATTAGANVLGKLRIGPVQDHLEASSYINDRLPRESSQGDGCGHESLGYETVCEDSTGNLTRRHFSSRPRAVYDLSHRFLAYVSPLSANTLSTSPYPVSISPSSSRGSIGIPANVPPPQPNPTRASGIAMPFASEMGSRFKKGMQTELENAAKSVWGGVRTLGGMAVEAARRRASGSAVGLVSGLEVQEVGPSSAIGKLFSRSAPDSGQWADLGIDSSQHNTIDDGKERSAAREDEVGDMRHSEAGYSVTVIDLEPLSQSSISSSDTEAATPIPSLVAEFVVSKGRQISQLSLSPDGCSLVIIPSDGRAFKVFRIQPALTRSDTRDTSTNTSGSSDRILWHQYNLRRGRTSAVVQHIEWSADGRWVAVGTRRGTVHVFGLNPFGGPVDVKSLLDGRPKDIENFHSLSGPVDIKPVARLRTATAFSESEPIQLPILFTFLKVSESTSLSTHFSPLTSHSHPHTLSSPPQSLTSVTSTFDGTSPPISPQRYNAAGLGSRVGLQNILLFHPGEGTLYLKKLALEVQPKDSGLASSLGGTTISFPGVLLVGSANWMAGNSPSSFGNTGLFGSPSNWSKLTNGQGSDDGAREWVLVARESTVTAWNLNRMWNGIEIKKGLIGSSQKLGRVGISWLSHAELSTFSKSRKILPRSIYLSHQFSFRTLGEDYYPLLRRYQFDVSDHKVDVRREVQISAYRTGLGESFVEGFPSLHRSQKSSSFDEPLASAMSSQFDHHHPPTSVLPMLPNGPRPQVFGSSIPISIRSMAGIGDGMSESLGRLRREMNWVRSPQSREPLLDHSVSPPVPLEFDEEDEDFVGIDIINPQQCFHEPASSGAEARLLASVDDTRMISSTRDVAASPIQHLDELLDVSDPEAAWYAWTSENMSQLEQVDRPNDSDVLGLLDEEQQRVFPEKIERTITRRRGR